MLADGEDDGPERASTDGRDERAAEHDAADAVGGRRRRRPYGRTRENDETIKTDENFSVPIFLCAIRNLY